MKASTRILLHRARNAIAYFWATARIRAGYLLFFSVALLFAITLPGCAKIVVKKLPADNNDSLEGIRFYRPAPYLMVTHVLNDSQSKSGPAALSAGETIQFSIVWMPDLSQEYVIQSKAGFGSVSFNPTLENGWNLTGLNASADSKTAELLTALAGFVPKAPMGTVAQKPQRFGPGLYRLLFETDPKNSNYGHLKGVDFDHPISFIPAQ